ncbi:MAG TPA: NAD(P)-dependent oxidoreductase [Burkholderiales bacterium]|nr:NAD(P)-dependent oxidoreductase [Burkholderiales bacterium]
MVEPIIVVPDDFPSIFKGTLAEERCARLGETRVYTERGADQETELVRRLDGARAAINIRAHARFSEAVFAACPQLKMISVWGTGTDNIDLESATRRGVTVSSTAGVNAKAVAEHTIALMLAVARRIPKIDHEMRTGAWPREMLTQCLGKTLGVFGTGTIGMRVVALGRALGMEVLAWSARGDTARAAAAGARAASKEQILREADIVTLHLRLSPETRGFLSQRELSSMKRPVILINTGRGALVERAALLDALGQGGVSAGLDVFHDEPLKADDPILALPNVVLSPHNAGQTPEVVHDGLLLAVENIEHFLQGRPTNVVVAPPTKPAGEGA